MVTTSVLTDVFVIMI